MCMISVVTMLQICFFDVVLMHWFGEPGYSKSKMTDVYDFQSLYMKLFNHYFCRVFPKVNCKIIAQDLSSKFLYRILNNFDKKD